MLQHKNSGVRLNAVSLLEKLTEHGALYPHALKTLLILREGKLRERLRHTIPLLGVLLEHTNSSVQLGAISLLEKFANNGVW